MAVINREACFYENQLGMAFRVQGPPTFEGIGWAVMPLDWVMEWRGEFEKVIFHGRAWLRVLHVDRGFPGCLYVVESSNRRWPLWWIILRGWLFLRWLERNTRMTAVVWGLIETEIGMRPWWGDMWPLPAVRRLRRGRGG